MPPGNGDALPPAASTSCTTCPASAAKVTDARSLLVAVVPFAVAGGASGAAGSTPVHEAAPQPAFVAELSVTTTAALPVGGATSCHASARTEVPAETPPTEVRGMPA
ncbi:MAG: hypothetical protein IVW36_11695 [Dehalococcoidia bacterium]|nr:hypothetical protein [Dehalococcoidia bacterium]